MSFNLFYQKLSSEESEMDKKYRTECHVFVMKMVLESFLTPEHLFITRASCLLCLKQLLHISYRYTENEETDLFV